MNLTSRFVSLPKLAAAATLTASLWLAGGSPLRADEDCQKRIARIDHKLHEAAEHHGWNSPQVQQYREELSEARDYCWQHDHRWWSEDDRRWHTEKDWSDHDHERERDKDRDRDRDQAPPKK